MTPEQENAIREIAENGGELEAVNIRKQGEAEFIFKLPGICHITSIDIDFNFEEEKTP